MELQHFSHDHQLIFDEVRENNYGWFHKMCYGCRKQVSGPNYSCKECNWFVLHKSCAELPRELRHPLHPKHPLLLSHDPEFLQRSKRKCEGCNRSDYLEPGFFYKCFDCNFYLERKCASLPLTIQPESHAHPLTLMRKSVSFTCDACGEEGKGMFYSCALCGFWVHLECTSFPLIVKHIRHIHSLNLSNSLQVPQSDHRVCRLCVKYVDTNYMVYHCSTCDYVNHLHCATNEQLWDDTKPIESTSGLDESIDSFPYIVLKSQLGEDKIEKPVEIKHFSHEHDLKLVDEQLENNEKCDACTWPIYPDPFYTCAQCRFFLHKSCVELPRKKSHPLHRHPLILLPKPPAYVDKHFRCKACKRLYNGFAYCCDKCRFNLDVQCSLMREIFTHDGHEHQLILSSGVASYDKCSSCDGKGQIFRCADCEFTLDFKCATLLPTVKYGPYEQPFKLCYKKEDDFYNEYYCDICEKERDPKHWFYYCRDLSFRAHPDCILGRHSYIMSGRTCRHDAFSDHLLALVDMSEGIYRLCDECGSLCCGLNYKCVNCFFSLHRWCFHKTTALTRQLAFPLYSDEH